MTFQIGDKVRCVSSGHGMSDGKVPPVVAGREYTISYVESGYGGQDALVGVDGQTRGYFFARRFEKVQEKEVGLTPEEAKQLKPGDRLRCVNAGGFKYLTEGKEYTFVRLWNDDGCFIIIDKYDNGTMPGGGMFSQRFVKVEQKEKPVNKTGAMGFDEARKQRQRLIEAGAAPAESIRLVTRSWDAEGRFAAVDVRPGFFANGKPQMHFQNVRQVDEFLQNFAPIDVAAYYITGSGENTQYYFRNPERGGYLAPSGNRMKQWWSLAEIQQIGGITVDNGRRYRLGTTAFKPLVDTEKA